MDETETETETAKGSSSPTVNDGRLQPGSSLPRLKAIEESASPLFRDSKESKASVLRPDGDTTAKTSFSDDNDDDDEEEDSVVRTTEKEAADAEMGHSNESRGRSNKTLGMIVSAVSGWKAMVPALVSVLFLVAVVATGIQRSGDQRLALDALLPDSEAGPIELEGRPLEDHHHHQSINDETTKEALELLDDHRFHRPTTSRELRFLVELLSPVVSQISEREGCHLTDYIASRRNDASIVLKGSPQHNALAWLSHAVVCRNHHHGGGSGDDEHGSDDDYNEHKKTVEQPHLASECASLLSRSQLLHRYALATMYFAWDGKSWQHAEGWLSYGDDDDETKKGRDDHRLSALWSVTKHPSDVCLWKGVICRRNQQHRAVQQDDNDDDDNKNDDNDNDNDDYNGNATTNESDGGEEETIVGLDLSGNHLVGYLAAVKELRWLGEHLETLDLSDNHLEGPIPEDLGLLEQLIELDLSHNGLSGSLPPAVPGNLSNLRVLRVEDNFLVAGLDGRNGGAPRLAPPLCGAADNTKANDNANDNDNDNAAPWTILSADCSGTKPGVKCPCCTHCCSSGNHHHQSAGSGLRGGPATREQSPIGEPTKPKPKPKPNDPATTVCVEQRRFREGDDGNR